MIPQRRSRSSELCLLCPKLCNDVCPVSEAVPREAFSPWAKSALAHLAAAPGAVASDRASESFSACTGCLRCTAHCPHGNDVPSILEEARASSVRGGSAPETLARLAMRFAAQGHSAPSGGADVAETAAALAHEEALRARLPRPVRAKESAEPQAMLFVGCEALARGPTPARRALAVARALGAPLLLAPESALCCGARLIEGGHPEMFAAHAVRTRKELLRAVERAPAKRPRQIVFLSSSCAESVRRRWPAAGAALPDDCAAEHITTYLARALAEHPQRARPKLRETVALHDPCSLARGLGETAAPRALLAAAVEGVREPRLCGAETGCCGAGSLLPETLPAASAEMARVRREQLAACEQPAVSATLGCSVQLGVEDLLELLARWLGV